MESIVIVAKMVISTIHHVIVSYHQFNIIIWKKEFEFWTLCLYSIDCNCDLQGTVGDICDKQEGYCICKDGYGGVRCDQCLPEFYNYPECIKCSCSTVGSSSTTCDANGKCPCLSNFAGKQCTQCSAGFYDYPQCLRKWILINYRHFFRLLLYNNIFFSFDYSLQLWITRLKWYFM